jgi:hypothetical protein
MHFNEREKEVYWMILLCTMYILILWLNVMTWERKKRLKDIKGGQSLFLLFEVNICNTFACVLQMLSAQSIACASIAWKMTQYKWMKMFTVRFKIPMLILQAISSDRSAGDWAPSIRLWVVNFLIVLENRFFFFVIIII